MASETRTTAERCHPALAAPERLRLRVVVEGLVQGVGFRPFIHRLAQRWQLAGTVLNFTGGVEIEVEGRVEDVTAFVTALRDEAPPLAVLEEIRTAPLPPTEEKSFVILPSRESAGSPILITPDIALCADCRRELRDPADRRYRYPFLNCTNCGPRYTITHRVPYDRPHTAMAVFALCDDCAREYHDLRDRRYHAQPVACPRCGPRLEYVRPGAAPRLREAALEAALALLRAGGVLAIKGLGGFHLACDATNAAAVQRLRQRKGREQKPFAVMVRDLARAERLAMVDAGAAQLLQAPQAPIVLVPKRFPEGLAPEVAPDSSDYGLLLPYTPLHELLLGADGLCALVMTSGNRSEEPLCVDNAEAQQRLADIADAFLQHDRDILVGCDDSVARWSPGGPILLRRARGYVPFPVRLARPVPPVLAVGGHLKNTVCFTNGPTAILSQHIGDLDNAASLEHFERIIAHLQAVLQVTPQVLACDLHPDYRSTRWAREAAERRGLPLVAVQHHHAHLVSCLADNRETGPVIGLACDGTGYGTDGTVWGCEVLDVTPQGFTRLGHLLPVPLPGGDAAVREPWRMAAVYLQATFGPDFRSALPPTMAATLDWQQWPALAELVARGLNAPLASSAGRLFDAVAALLGLGGKAAFEGQQAMALEALAGAHDEGYPYLVARHEAGLVLDPRPLLGALVRDGQRGVARPQLAARFHEGFAQMLAEAARQAAAAAGRDTVALSGGTFQNRRLLERLTSLLEQSGLRVLRHRAVPPNDGGLALGQAMVAAGWGREA